MAETKKTSIADEFADLTGAQVADEFADLLAAAPQEAAAPVQNKILVPRTGFGSALEALGILNPAIERPGKPKVGGGETFLSKAVNMVPVGGLATDLLSAGALLGNRSAGAAVPDSVLRTMARVPGVGALAPAAGPGAVLTPKAKKELEAIGVDTSEPAPPGAIDTYRHARDRRRARTEAGAEQNPLTALAGSGAGLGLSLLAPLPRFTPKGGADAGVLARIASGGKTGGAYGALAGATSGDADLAGGDWKGTATQTLFGGALGLGFGAALPALGAGARALYRGVVTPTPAAQALQEEGVKGLTLGQMDPKSALGNFERAVVSKPVVGPMIAGQREVADESFRVAALNKVRPPGMKELPQGTEVPEAMGKLQTAFNRAYRAVDELPAPTLAADRMLTRIAQPNVRAAAGATETAIKDAEQQIANQMTLLPPEGTTVPVGLLRTIRTNLREAIRMRAGGDKDAQAAAKLLREAEKELTDGISRALPEDAAKLLQRADAQYGKFKVLEDAAFRAGDTEAGMGAFTPARLTSALKTAARQRGSIPEFNRGGGGALRTLSSQGVKALAEAKPTGWGASMAGGPLGYFAAPLVYAANRPGVQPLMLGQAPSQQAVQAAMAELGPVFSALNPPQTFLPQALAEALRANKETP